VNMHDFSRENRQRCEAPNGFRHPLNGWSLAEWMNATTGELGEACGQIKELLRARDGVPGKGQTQEQIMAALADELADTFIYLDLLAQAAGVDLATAVRSKFDRTSAKIGYIVKDTNP
jgi:NTP pyrophosphatase (non-canonical NTP hydrolase)